MQLTIRPGPRPLTATRTALFPRSRILVLMEIAVACAAMFVPFLVFLKPSTPHERMICVIPLLSVILIIVLLGLVLMLTIGNSLKGIPKNSVVGVEASGKIFALLETIAICKFCINSCSMNSFYP